MQNNVDNLFFCVEPSFIIASENFQLLVATDAKIN